MYPPTSHESDTTDKNVIGWGLWRKMTYKDYMGYDSTEMTIRIAPLEGGHVKTRCNGDVIESALAPHQDSAAPDLLIEPELSEIRSVGPQRRFLARGLIKRVRRIGPSKVDPSWVR